MTLMFLAKLLAFLLLTQAAPPIEKFILKNFQKTLVLISKNFDNDKLTSILHLHCPKLIVQPKNTPNLELFNNYLIIEQNATTLSSSINMLKHKINKRGYFLVMFLQDAREDETKSAFETLWRSYIHNIVIYINWSSLVTWYPYKFKNRCGTIINPVRVQSSNPYKNKIPKVLNGCSFNVTWDELPLALKNPFNKSDPGFSIRVLDTVGEAIKANVIYLEQNVKSSAGLNNMDAAWKNELLQRSIDLTFLTSGIFGPVGPEFELSVSYFQTYIFFVLPPRRKITSSTNTLVVFSTEIWSLIITTVVLMTILWKVLTRRSFKWCFFQILKLMLQVPIQRIPSSTLMRIVFVFFFIYAANLNWIYVSELSSILSKPSYEPKISTVEELALSGKKLRFLDIWDKYFQDNKFQKTILDKKIHIPHTQISFNDELNSFVSTLDHGMINSNIRINFFKNSEKLHVVGEDKIITLHWYFLVRKGFPFLEKINHVLLKITESGLMSKWLYESQITATKITIPDYEDVEGFLDIDRIFCVFVLLGVGLSVSMVVFIFERTCKK
ncbi:hypothetical protein Zmor_018047 [Zophobas morio]|uniref:Ionotropic receptor n=1 Tax=Zophobas morio TaxID=2755281 RepID=A0AA38I677_9CUCU|nr:hypothetical protein Zmor_018047 [Zophobas morio]